MNTETMDMQQSADTEGEDVIADFSDDEDLEERARQEFETENADYLRLSLLGVNWIKNDF